MLRSVGESIAFYFQAVRGHASLLVRRRRIDSLLAGTTLTPGLRQQLEAIQRIRRWRDAGRLAVPAHLSWDCRIDAGDA